MFDASKLINEFLGAAGSMGSGNPTNGKGSSGADGGDLLQRGKDYLSQNAGGIGGGALAGGLAGYMLGSKKGRKMAKKAATYGGLALVAGLAYKAYSDYKGKQAGVPVVDGQVGPGEQSIPAHLHVPAEESRTLTHVPVVPMGSGFEVNEMTERASGFGATLVSAMIAAAKADGQIDASEQQAIFEKIGQEDLSAEEKAFLLDQLNKPLDIDSLVSQVQSREQAMEVYLASLLAIEPDTPSEQAYLTLLAARLGLEPELTEQIHQTLLSAQD
ncbi:tellurite resistance TerB family protein [Cohaesibacter haloalkalitolerans]|uniref:tellurite resistance TerB family protein n=1 Tax=Cohaesibacter haloalkalitolerans TaxID=1162980 RepID=UPI000E64FFC2|nr:tellurite resistance TerB family protein [Cohaesibacter haloalkalitolerans]